LPLLLGCQRRFHSCQLLVHRKRRLPQVALLQLLGCELCLHLVDLALIEDLLLLARVARGGELALKAPNQIRQARLFGLGLPRELSLLALLKLEGLLERLKRDLHLALLHAKLGGEGPFRRHVVLQRLHLPLTRLKGLPALLDLVAQVIFLPRATLAGGLQLDLQALHLLP